MKVAIVVLLFVCLTASVYGDKVFQYSRGQTSAAETVGTGDKFVVSLESNPSTGYRWEIKSTLVKTQMTSAGDNGVIAAPNSGAIGRPGRQTFEFVGKEAGTETLNFLYRRPWEDSGASTFDLTITVSP